MKKIILINLLILLFAFHKIQGTEEPDYSIIINKNLFSPSRTYNNDEDFQKEAPRPIKAVLYGTAILKTQKIAFIEEQNEKGRFEKRQIKVGDEICGYKVKDILTGCIVLIGKDGKIYNFTFETNKERRKRYSTIMPKTGYNIEKKEISHVSHPASKRTASEAKMVKRPMWERKKTRPKIIQRKKTKGIKAQRKSMSPAEQAKLKGVIEKLLPTELSSQDREKVIKKIMEIHKNQKLVLPER
ncbi:MAG: hypothetical protein DRP81_03535 [Candidatus Omnitrophota bacterium]|nr:MAG: hypothetical protein DRP81_03535 [Candidatus Omnitrophota bacterium]